MTLVTSLQLRSDSKCELCGASNNLTAFAVAPHQSQNVDENILICATCNAQIEGNNELDVHHWRCLNDCMWSPAPAVQVITWRMLTKLNNEPWASDALDLLYLDDATLSWAKSGIEDDDSHSVKHLDSHGVILAAGDTVNLTKDLTVKGANFTAKRGTAVRGISLVADNPKHIEGRINGQQIVILTEFVKKA